MSLDGFWIGQLVAQNSCTLWWTPKVKCSPKKRTWWQEFLGWYWIQYNTSMTFSLIEYLEYVFRWYLERLFSCTKFLWSLVDSQSSNVHLHLIWWQSRYNIKVSAEWCAPSGPFWIGNKEQGAKFTYLSDVLSCWSWYRSVPCVWSAWSPLSL